VTAYHAAVRLRLAQSNRPTTFTRKNVHEANMHKRIQNTRARRVLYVCFMFASSCKRGINDNFDLWPSGLKTGTLQVTLHRGTSSTHAYFGYSTPFCSGIVLTSWQTDRRIRLGRTGSKYLDSSERSEFSAQSDGKRIAAAANAAEILIQALGQRTPIAERAPETTATYT